MASIYVAASFAEYERALACKRLLEGYGLGVTSAWIESAVAVEGNDPCAGASVRSMRELDSATIESLEAAAALNDSAIEHSDIVLVLSSDAAKETFAEARLALALGKFVVWVGFPRPLSAYRPGVRRFEADDVACAFLCGYAGPVRRERIRSALLPSVREEYGKAKGS